jgi:L,D-transpeptidase YcbB
MANRRFDRILTGTAIALVLSLTCASAPALAQSTLTDAEIEAKVPLPDVADVPPPTAADVGGTSTATLPTQPAPAPQAAAPQAPATPAPQAAAPQPPAATTAPVGAPAVAANPDAPTIDALRDLITTKLTRMVDRKADRAAIEAFYAGRNYAPLWMTDGAANERAKSAMARLSNADEDGLDPADYPLPLVKAGAEPAALADAEIRLTNAVLAYARHAQIGRVHYSRVSADVAYNLVPPEPAEVLTKMVSTANAGDALLGYQPPHAAYKALRAKLAEMRGRRGEAGPAKIPSGPVLKYAKTKRGGVVLMQDERVPLLRERLGLPAVKDDINYDSTLLEAVAAFQKQKGLPANGSLTQQTVDALNGRRPERDADIIMANMERWRWVPRDLGKAHVVLNIPDYTLQVYNNGASIWKTRVVVGKPGTHATPLLSETMKYITINPTWNVPPSIVYNEYLPALQQDPTVLKRMGLNLVQNRDGSVHISQPPGEGNALGRIRFNFPNKFLVYQHDTPDKNLFAHERRAYSHGCMRVQDPAKYAEVLLSLALPGQGYTQERIKSMYGRAEQDIKFPNPIPVHITYQTAFVDDHGHLQIRDDIYGRDQRLLVAMKSDERKVAEIPVERAQPNYSRPSVRLPSGVGEASYTREPSFFERLFGNPVQPPAPIPNQRRAARSITR